MKILCISTNNSRLIVPTFPLGWPRLWHPWGSTMKFGWWIACLRPTALRLLPNYVQFQPELIALSMRNLDNQDSCQPVFYFPEIKEFIDKLRTYSGSPIIIGGSAFNIFPLELAEYLAPDFGLVGEGELSFRTFVDTYPNLNYADIPGLVWKNGTGWRLNQPEVVS